MLNITEINECLLNLNVKDFTFEAKSVDNGRNGIYLMAITPTIDPTTGEQLYFKTGMLLSTREKKDIDSFLKCVRELIIGGLIHELDEHFLYKGTKPFDPHETQNTSKREIAGLDMATEIKL